MEPLKISFRSGVCTCVAVAALSLVPVRFPCEKSGRTLDDDLLRCLLVAVPPFRLAPRAALSRFSLSTFIDDRKSQIAAGRAHTQPRAGLCILKSLKKSETISGPEREQKMQSMRRSAEARKAENAIKSTSVSSSERFCRAERHSFCFLSVIESFGWPNRCRASRLSPFPFKYERRSEENRFCARQRNS